MATDGKTPWSPVKKMSEGEMMTQIKTLRDKLKATTTESKPKPNPTFLLMPSQKK